MTVLEKLVVLIFLACVAAVYALEILLILHFAADKLWFEKTTNILSYNAAGVVHLLAIVGIICLLYAYFIEPRWIEVKTIRIRTEKLTKTCIRLVHISDLHCDKKPRNEKKLVKLVNTIKPDVIVFTGDCINTHTALPLFKETLKSLEANLAKLAVYGNVDFLNWRNLELFDGTGFELMTANTVTLEKNGETFYVSGLSYDKSAKRCDFLKNIPDNRFSIFMYHYPDLVEDLKNLNVDLYLAGHTHGGQVALPCYGALTTLSKFGKKYEAGMYQINDKILYVNRGLGLDGGLLPRVRFFARPEITIFDIKPNGQRKPNPDR